MSDNKITLRNKFISRLVKKSSKITEAINLLVKFNNKTSSNQHGGSLVQLGMKLADIQAAAGGLQARIQNLDGIVTGYNTRANQVFANIRGINLNNDVASEAEITSTVNILTVLYNNIAADVVHLLRTFITKLITNDRNVPVTNNDGIDAPAPAPNQAKVEAILGAIIPILNAVTPTANDKSMAIDTTLNNGANAHNLAAGVNNNLKLAINTVVDANFDTDNPAPVLGNNTKLSAAKKKEILLYLCVPVYTLKHNV